MDSIHFLAFIQRQNVKSMINKNAQKEEVTSLVTSMNMCENIGKFKHTSHHTHTYTYYTNLHELVCDCMN